MKIGLQVIAVLVQVVAMIPASAQSKLDRELTQLMEQKEKALAAAIEPVNRQYQKSLETMLRRAMQTGDLETAVKIKGELEKLGASQQAAEEPADSRADSFAKRLVGTKWYWFDRETITFLEDGKAQWKENPEHWPWEVTSAGRRTIEGVNKANGKKWTITFDRNLTTGSVEGDGGSRKLQRILPEPPK